MHTSSLYLPIDLGILGSREVEVTFCYFPGYPASREYPAEPEHLEIEDITLSSNHQHISLFPLLATDVVSWFETLTYDMFVAKAESAATDLAIDRWEDQQRAFDPFD
jgi:hypothetical protein